MPSAILYGAGPAGLLRALAGVGSLADGASLRALAETLGSTLTVLDPPGGSFAAGIRLGHDEGALLVVSPTPPTPGSDWEETFGVAAQLALSLVRAEANDMDRLPLLHEVAVHPGGFDERLTYALQRSTEILGLDAAAFARTSGGRWIPQSLFDPLSRLFTERSAPLGEMFCAYTSRSDGPLAIEDASATSLGISSPRSYIGAPVFVGGRCVGTFFVAGVAARKRPFSDEDRALVEALARWVGVALAGRALARHRAARMANLTAFFDGSPLGMGVVQVIEGDLDFVAINTAAAEALGSSPDAVTGRRATDVGLNSSLVRKWISACEVASRTGQSRRVEVEVGTTMGLRRLVTTVAPMPSAGDPRYTFVVEDVTTHHYERRSKEATPSEPDEILDQSPAAHFAADLDGRITHARGTLADRVGLR
ncbi:GAF domain-containing protein, partial [Rubrivirga sp.]|uniref:GAF domain-containing protein n=1 Tax=Rubrivirga sp. TaxID=1885344 RepID=UPI003C715B3E